MSFVIIFYTVQIFMNNIVNYFNTIINGFSCNIVILIPYIILESTHEDFYKILLNLEFSIILLFSLLNI